MKAKLPTSEGVWFAESDKRAYNKVHEGADFRDMSRSEFLRDSGTLLAEIDQILHQHEMYFPNKRERHAFIKQAVLDKLDS